MRKICFLLVFSFLLVFNANSQESRANSLHKICIDPGHGGDKPGARGARSLEKDINLQVSLKLGKLINQHLKDVEVIYTRKTDIDVDLIKRSQFANRNKADLFISIHCNASSNKQAYGTETFAMGLTKSKENLEVARKENADILTETDYEVNYEGFDPNSPEGSIFFSLYQNAFLEQSLSFADKIQKEFTKNTGLFNRGVKQAGFLVLFRTSMPGVLVEIGFISNRKEEDYLMSEKGQYEVAASIFRAICQYKIQKEGKTFTIPSVEELVPKNIEKEEKIEETKKENIAENHSKENQISNSLVYRIQFFTCENKLDFNDKKFKNLEKVWTYRDNNRWKYTSGEFTNYNDAINYQKEVRKKGYSDAFIVCFNNEKRISLSEARKFEKNKNN
ncbi:MAG: N-acetylmuramoyl-L-alanine amidase [Bacteroidales bacterium]